VFQVVLVAVEVFVHLAISDLRVLQAHMLYQVSQAPVLIKKIKAPILMVKLV
jgi:hypothetical protein